MGTTRILSLITLVCFVAGCGGESGFTLQPPRVGGNVVSVEFTYAGSKEDAADVWMILKTSSGEILRTPLQDYAG